MAGVLLTQVHRYKVQLNEALGRGAYGVVYKASHIDFPGKTYAAKRVHLGGPRDMNELLNCERLKEIAQGNNNVVKIHDVIWPNAAEGITDLYIFTEFCAYGDLSRFIKDHLKDLSTLPSREFLIKCQLMCQISNGLEYLHTNNMAHRDMKPQNILVQKIYGNIPQVKIADYGLSKFIPSDGEATSAMQSNVGTNAFKSPQFWGINIRYHRSADIFSTGVTFLAMSQYRENQNFCATIEGSIDQGEVRLPIGQVMFMRRCNNQPQPQIVKVNDDDDMCTKMLKEVIFEMLTYDENERITAYDLHQKMKELTDVVIEVIIC